jgi:hypothetical protein
MSTRTLRNKLTRETTSYRELVEEGQEELAEQLPEQAHCHIFRWGLIHGLLHIVQSSP